MNTKPSAFEIGTRFRMYNCIINSKKGVALTGRNTTGPPRAAPGELRCTCAVLRTTDDRRRQTPPTVTSLPTTLCVGGPVIMQA